MNYQEALEFLYRQLPMFSRIGAAAYKPGLDTSLALDAKFCHPHRKFKSIHIGGTNGKGSTSHMIAAILQSQGYKVGLYTSPHLVDFRERMRINGEMIPKEEVIDFVEKWQNTDYEGHPSFFELTMMMAFDWFARRDVDIAVIEVGMGGRLDSTNIITPELCVITNISKDHSQFLGATLPAIASEKAGIIKPGIPVVIGEAEGEIRKVFEDKANSIGAPIIFSEDAPRIITLKPHNPAGWEGVSSEGSWVSPLSGDYQKKNLNTVLHTVDTLKKIGYEISNESVVQGISNVETMTGLRGRWSILNESPLMIADTGHNIAGLTFNMNQLQRLMTQRPDGTLRIVIGFVADKDIDTILGILPKNAVYYITNAAIPRALPASDLAPLMSQKGLHGNIYPTVKEACEGAIKEADSQNDIIFIGGSTFIVADYLTSAQRE